MLERVTFRNFKSLVDVGIPLARFTCLVGPNGAGKTSVLEGLHKFSRLGVRHPDEGPALLGRAGLVFRGRHAPDRVRSVNGTHDIAITCEGELTASCRIFKPKGSEDDWSVALSVGADSKTLEATWPRSPNDSAQDILTALQRSGLGACIRLRLSPETLARPSFSESELPRVGYDGTGLASVLAYLRGLADDVTIKAIEQGLKAVVPDAGRLQTKPALIEQTEHEILMLDATPVNRDVKRSLSGHRFELEWGKQFVPADLLSEGTLLSLGLLTVLHTASPRLLLLDDIDRGLHPRAQREIVDQLRKVLESDPKLQIVCSTHSPLVLGCFQPDEVRVLKLDPEGKTIARRLTQHPQWPAWKDSLDAGEFWSFVGEDWVFEDRHDG